MHNQITELGLVVKGGRAVVSSRDVARVFEKQHGHVLRDIRSIIENDTEWGISNFGETPYTDPQNGQTYREYQMTRDGFTILVMGYTGEKAMSFKKAYIKAFNEMEAKLRSTALPVSYKDALKALIVEIEAKEALEAKNAVLQLAADKYEGQTDTIELYKIGEIAEEFGISAVALNKFLHDQRIQYKPNGSDVWRLYTEHSAYNYAFPKLVTLDNGFTKPMLFWTAKGRDFIHDVVEKAQPHWYA